MKKFEIGNIYPPFEKNALKIQVTQGCSWNKCSFCSSYQGLQFRIRTLDEIRSDVEAILFYQNTEDQLYKDTYFFDRVASWNGDKVFFGDCDVLEANIIGTIQLVKESFPDISQFCSYASIRNLIDTDDEHLHSGLTRLHIGFETGCADVLELTKKPHSVDQILRSHERARGIELFDHYIIGLGGRKWSRKHATESARLLNEVNPKGIELRTIQFEEGTRIKSLIEPMDENELREELELFLSELKFDGKVYNNHESNKWI